MGPARPPRVLALWSAPRCRSTAFFRMMLERGDFDVLHEPFSYLAEFGGTDVFGRHVATEAQALAAIRAAGRRRPVFFKDTTDERYPGVLADESFLATDAVHAFLIRHPRCTVPSYHAVNPEVRCDQIGFAHLAELYEAVARRTATTPVVIDADELASAPDRMVRGFCAAVGIQWLPHAMSWSAGPRPEWQRTERWHREVSATSGFQAPNGARPAVTDPRLADMVRRQEPFYLSLHARRLRP